MPTTSDLASVFAAALATASASEIDEALFAALDAAEAEYVAERAEAREAVRVSREVRTALTVA